MNRWIGLAAASSLSACTGLSFGENLPGADTFLDDGIIRQDDATGEVFSTGSIAVDPRDGTALVLHHTLDGPDAGRRLVGGLPGGVAREVARLDHRSDSRLLFPEAGVLLMSEDGLGERLELFETGTLRSLAARDVDARYHGTRTSPSGRWVVVADNDGDALPLHLIDPRTLAEVVVPHGGHWLEGVWLHGRDVFVAAVFGQDRDEVTGAERSTMRLLAWSFEDGAPLARPEVDGVWADPIVDVTIPDCALDLLVSYTWVGVAPDDRTVVVPAQRVEGAAVIGYELVVLELGDGSVRRVPDLRGPVGFSPDSSAIVAYRHDGGEVLAEEAVVVLLDRDTLETTDVLVPYAPQYLVTPGAHVVVIAPSAWDDGPLLLHDLETGTTTEVDNPRQVRLEELVTRPEAGEVWLVDDEGLNRLDLVAGTLEAVDPGWVPWHVNRSPDGDLLVLDDDARARLVWWDPDARAVRGELALR